MDRGLTPRARTRGIYANVMSTLAVFIALGGTSYAVATLPRNSVGERQLRAGAVSTSKIRAGAVTRDKLADGVARGPRGPQGSAGPAGPSGPPGPVGPSEVLLSRAPGGGQIPTGAGGSLTVASLTLAACDWSLDGQAKIDYDVVAADWFDCDLVASTGGMLLRSTARLGNVAGAVLTSTLPVHTAVRLTVSTRVALVCSHIGPESTNPAVVSQGVLRATRVETVTTQ